MDKKQDLSLKKDLLLFKALSLNKEKIQLQFGTKINTIMMVAVVLALLM